MAEQVRVLLEITAKKVYASALDWPGIARSGRDEAAALAALAEAAPRYARVAARAGHPFPADPSWDVVDRVDGDASTAFGVPAIVVAADREPLTADAAARLADLVAACWAEFDAVAAAAPESLRKGPRGGGRDRSKVIEHVLGGESAYAAVLGRKHRPTSPETVAAMRADLAELLRQPSDGSPVAGRRWPPRYAARRIGWHVMDHAWEIEDRTDPVQPV